MSDFKENTQSLKAEYERMAIVREPYLTKAKEACKYTIPSLLNDEKNSIKKVKQPNQSVGADGVNNLSAKITLSLLPPNQPFYKFSIDEVDLKTLAIEAGEDNPDQYAADVTKGLSLTEQMLINDIEQKGDRVCVGEGMKHVLIAGNVLFIDTLEEGLKMYPLTRYVVKRDYFGNVLKAICVETIGYSALPQETQEEIKKQYNTEDKKNEDGSKIDLNQKEFTLYTSFQRTQKHWLVSQEVEGIIIEKSKGKYPIEICPFMALRYTRIDGEDYGRGLIEEYIGDISYLDVLSLAIKQSALAASKLIFLVNPAGVTKVKNVAETPNGGFASGKIDDIQALQANKYYDLQTARQEKESLEKKLQRVFLLTQSVQRDAERVTAEEIRYMIRELEEAHGNLYSILSKEFQYTFVKITFYHLRKSKKNQLPDLVRDKKVKLTVTTGLEALGRGSDLNKLAILFDTAGKYVPVAQQLGMNPDKVVQLIASSMNIDISGVQYTDEEKQAMQQQIQQQELINKVAPNMVNQMGSLEKAAMQQEGENNGG